MSKAGGRDRFTHRMEEHYRALFQNSPICMWEEDFSRIRAFIETLRADGVEDLDAHLREHPEAMVECVRMIQVLDVNQRALEFYGASDKQQLIHSLPAIFDDRAYDVLRREIVALANGSTTFDSEIFARTLAGEQRLVDMRISVVPTPEVPWSRLIVSFVDLTERKRLEQQIIETQRLESVGRLAGAIAHDFNNLLTVINGYSEMLLELADSGTMVHNGLTEIQKAGENARALTTQLLVLSRRETARPEPLDLNDLIHRTASTLQNVLGGQIDVRLMLSPHLDPVLADPVQMDQVLKNLAVNARDAMSGAGRLTIETSNVQIVGTEAEQDHSMTPGSYVRMRVADTGEGWDEAAQAHLFEPFFPTGKPGKRAGLGLSIVFGIVKQNGGSIFADSTPDKGACITIYLPRTDRAVEKRVAPQAEPSLRGAETILLAEDRPEVRNFVRQTLASYGYEVLEANDGTHALQLFTDHGEVDLLLTDMMMPAMDGRELAERIRALRPATKVIFMSGYTDQLVLDSKILTEGTAFLHKPISPVILARKIRELLGPPVVSS